MASGGWPGGVKREEEKRDEAGGPGKKTITGHVHNSAVQ